MWVRNEQADSEAMSLAVAQLLFLSIWPRSSTRLMAMYCTISRNGGLKEIQQGWFNTYFSAILLIFSSLINKSLHEMSNQTWGVNIKPMIWLPKSGTNHYTKTNKQAKNPTPSKRKKKTIHLIRSVLALDAP